MGWGDLLQTDDEKIVSPWLGGRDLRSGERTWKIDGKLPRENGWYVFKVTGRKAVVCDSIDPDPSQLRHLVKGFLVGDRIVPDDTRVDPDPAKIVGFSETVNLIETGLDRFVRVSAGRTHEGGPLVYIGLEFPLGPEADVLRAFLDQEENVNTIKAVPPSLDAAFRMERWQKIEAERRRVELERIRREEEEKRRIEEKRQEIARNLGNAQTRRELAQFDFEGAARAALAVGGAELLDQRASYRQNEMVVRFRFMRRRFECVCDRNTLAIIDSGICLVDHDTDVRGDTWFTLESLPSVIKEAIDQGKLVVFRHVD